MENDFESVWARIREETGIKSLQALADILKKTQPAISKAKAKGEFPAGWAFIVGRQFGLLTEWIMTGEGPRRLEEIKGNFAFYEDLEEWARETGRSEDIQWLRNQIESFFPMFTEWKKRRAEGDEAGDEFPSSKVA